MVGEFSLQNTIIRYIWRGIKRSRNMVCLGSADLPYNIIERGAVSLKRDSIPKSDSVLEDDNVLEGNNIKGLPLALVNLHLSIPVCPQEPSLYRFSKQLQD